MHLLAPDFTWLILARLCRDLMESRRRHSRLILPLKNYHGSNRAPTASAQLLFSRSIPFIMENGPANMSPLTALLWRRRSIILTCRPTTPSLMANRYDGLALPD